MKTINQWLLEYSEDHQNKINSAIHKIAVPLIVTSLLGMLWCLPKPDIFQGFLNWASIALVSALLYYVRLSLPFAAGMLAFGALQMSLFFWLEAQALPILPIMVTAFIVGWLLQFYGHSIEGRRPSFLTDLRYLLIGPLWVLASLFALFGLEAKKK